MSGGAHRSRRSGVGEDVVLFRTHVRTLIHVLRRAAGSGTGAHASGAIAHQLHGGQRAVLLCAHLQVNARVWAITG